MIRRNAAVRGGGAVAGRAAAFNSDIYALGLILFEILTGSQAVDSKTLAYLNDISRLARRDALVQRQRSGPCG
jgi:hypothetical protein